MGRVSGMPAMEPTKSLRGKGMVCCAVKVSYRMPFHIMIHRCVRCNTYATVVCGPADQLPTAEGHRVGYDLRKFMG